MKKLLFLLILFMFSSGLANAVALKMEAETMPDFSYAFKWKELSVPKGEKLIIIHFE